MTRTDSSRRRWALLGAIVGVAVTVVGLTKVSIDAGVDSFVAAKDPTLAATNRVAESFGGDPIVVLLESDEPHKLLTSTNISAMLRLEGALAVLDNVATVYGPTTVLNQIAGQAQDFLAELVGMRDGLKQKAEDEARKAGAGPGAVRAAGQAAVDAFDKRYLPLMTQGLPAGLPTLRNEKFVANVVYNSEGDPRPQWSFVVPDANSVAILIRPNPDLRQSEVETLVSEVKNVVADRDVRGARVTVSGVPAIVASLGERIQRDVVLLGGLALAGVGAWFVLMPWIGRRRRLLPLAVSLVGTAVTLAAAGWLDLPLSFGAVAFLPVLLGVGSDFMIYLLTRVSTRLVTAAALATSASFAALGATPIVAVRQLGWTLAIGVLVTFIVSVLAVRFLGPGESDDAEPSVPATRSAAPKRRRVAIAVLVSLVAASGWALLPHLRLDADFQTLARNLAAYDDAQHVQEVMGSSGEVDVAIVGRDVATPEVLAWMRKADEAIVLNHGDEMRPILSLPTLLRFLGAKPTDEEFEASLRLLPSYLTSSVIRNDHRMAVMSYGVNLDDATRLQKLRDDVLADLPPPPRGIKVELVGLPMVAVSSYESLASDRFLNAGSGILVAGLVLLIFLRRRRDAGIAVVSATVTTGLVLLGMYVLGIGLNPITAAVGSLAAAVACEFTVILLDSRRSGHGRRHRMVPLAAAASATGYGVLAMSGVTSIREFGLLLAVTVVVAAVVAHLTVWAGAVGLSEETSE